jgi:hypothetical protein
MYTLASTAYLESEANAQTSVCYIEESDWEQRLLESPDIRRLFAMINFPDGSTRISAVEHVAARHVPSHMERPIFLPLWMLPETTSLGEAVDVEFFSQDAFPEASRIVLKPLDSAFYSTDVKHELTECLSRLGVLKRHDTVLLRLDGLGGFEMGFYVVDLEPADLVLLNAEEVVVEFEEAADQWDGRRPDTHLPEEPAVLETAAPGQVLGGGPVRRMPDGRPWNPYRCA